MKKQHTTSNIVRKADAAASSVATGERSRSKPTIPLSDADRDRLLFDMDEIEDAIDDDDDGGDISIEVIAEEPTPVARASTTRNVIRRSNT